MRSARKKAQPKSNTLTLSSKFIDVPTKNDDVLNESTQSLNLCDEQKHIRLEHQVILNFPMLWSCRKNNYGRDYFIGTCFDSSKIAVSCATGIDFVEVSVLGVNDCEVVFKDTANGVNSRDELVRVSPVEHEMYNCQKITFKTPYSCCHLDMSFSPVAGDFLCILEISVFSSSMPSSMSTPVDKSKRRVRSNSDDKT
jgi:hypothetical protein